MFSKKKRNDLQKKENQKHYLWKTITLKKKKKKKSLGKDDITRNTSLKDGLCYTGSMEWGYIA